MAQVHLRGVRKSYDKLEVIHGVDIEIADGEFVVIVGPSGCGKSTLLRMVAGLERITGGTQRLTRVVGRSMALDLVTTGRQVKADEALRIGLANHVVAPEALLDKGLELARMIAAKGPVAVRFSKHLVIRGQDLDLANANVLETDVFGLLCATDDRREGMAAFLEKRPAKFTGK